MPRYLLLTLAWAWTSFLSTLAAAEPSAKFECKIDGQPWATRPVQALATTRPVIGTKLTINIWADNREWIPYLQVTADWKRLKAKAGASITVANATADSPLDAVWTDKPLPEGHPLLNAPELYLENGHIKLGKRAANETVDLTFDLVFREGDVKAANANASNRQARVSCTGALAIKDLSAAP